jgi:hypothetical protein
MPQHAMHGDVEYILLAQEQIQARIKDLGVIRIW